MYTPIGPRIHTPYQKRNLKRRSAGIAVLLAQCGAYVPCDAMEWTPVDRLLCRVGASDSQLRGAFLFGLVWFGLVWFVCIYVCMYVCLYQGVPECMHATTVACPNPNETHTQNRREYFHGGDAGDPLDPRGRHARLARHRRRAGPVRVTFVKRARACVFVICAFTHLLFHL